MPTSRAAPFSESDLQPAARRAAEIDDAGAALEDVEFLVDLPQLVGGAGAIAGFLRLAHIGITQLAIDPVARGFGEGLLLDLLLLLHRAAADGLLDIGRRLPAATALAVFRYAHSAVSGAAAFAGAAFAPPRRRPFLFGARCVGSRLVVIGGRAVDHREKNAFAQAAIAHAQLGGGPGGEDGVEDGHAGQHQFGATAGEAWLLRALFRRGAAQAEDGVAELRQIDGDAIDHGADIAIKTEMAADEAGDRSRIADELAAAGAEQRTEARGGVIRVHQAGDMLDHAGSSDPRP